MEDRRLCPIHKVQKVWRPSNEWVCPYCEADREEARLDDEARERIMRRVVERAAILTGRRRSRS